MLSLQRSLCYFRRYYSNSSSAQNILQHLEDRALIRVSGTDVSEYLQGLITNDINHLSHGPGSMFTMFLNVKGRVLFDSIIYKTRDDTTYLIECDSEATIPLQKHLKMYKVRRKIDITSLDESHRVYVMFNNVNLNTDLSAVDLNFDGVIVPCDQLKPETAPMIKMYKDLFIFKDPRVANLGSRIIASNDIEVKSQISEITRVISEAENSNSYKILRYKLGIGEGVQDLPPGNCFPLECNCDYLHGISFHKGCYIGQELTARTHHTGVVRKRLLPLYFETVPKILPTDNNILVDKVRMGKLRGIVDNVGLGLLRVKDALELKKINVGDGVAKVMRPNWWPVELPKEKMGVQKS